MQVKLNPRIAVALAGAAMLWTSPVLRAPARACGGFWCSRSAPVNQAAEEIMFVDHGDGSVTAIIQISYVGPSQKFAWVIPMPGKPDIAVSSSTAFQRLDTATAPQYSLDVKVEGTCKPGQFFPGGVAESAAPTASNADAGAAVKGITVIDSGSVGPYDYDTIAVDPTLSSPADAAINWFMAHGYDLSGVDDKVLGPYLSDGLNLLAFKLTKGTDSGSIRPVILTYQSQLPSIPIRPTAVAAQDNMGILVWVAARDQAVPENYKSLVINDALINWFNFQQNYNDVVTAAANEAGGQGFVTELADSIDAYKSVVSLPQDESALTMLKSQTFTDGIDAIFAANQYYRGWDGWRDSIAAATTLPAGVSIDDFGRNPDMYRGTAMVDTAKFLMLLEQNVVQPVIDTQNMLNTRPYLTRLYSTMSADEMTVDPAFTYNSDLANVSNKHVATEYIMCTADVYQYDAPWRIELPQGGVISGKGGNNWPIEAGSLPANLKIVQLSTQGSGKVVMDNSGMIGTMLFQQSGMMPMTASTSSNTGTGGSSGASTPPPTKPATGVMIGGSQMVTMPAGTGVKMSGGGCAVSADVGSSREALASFALLFGFGALFGVRLRRRRRLVA